MQFAMLNRSMIAGLWVAGRRGSAAIPSTAVRSVAELPLGGKVLPVNPNKSKAAAALFEIASHPSPLQRQPSAHQHPAALASSAEVADSEVKWHFRLQGPACFVNG